VTPEITMESLENVIAVNVIKIENEVITDGKREGFAKFVASN